LISDPWILGLLLIASAVAALAQDTSAAAETARPASVHDGQHDFDWEFGNWHTQSVETEAAVERFLTNGSSTTAPQWCEKSGTDAPIWWNSIVNGPTHIEALNLRLYNPETHKWSLNFASSKGGLLGMPTVGEFKNGRGSFTIRKISTDDNARALHHLRTSNQNPASSSSRSQQMAAGHGK